jgi:hypothetical protein
MNEILLYDDNERLDHMVSIFYRKHMAGNHFRDIARHMRLYSMKIILLSFTMTFNTIVGNFNFSIQLLFMVIYVFIISMK